MILSKRERWIVIATVSVIAVLVLDRYALTPLLDAREAAGNQRTTLLGDLERSQAMLQHQRQLDPQWKTMVADGLKEDPTEAESQVLHAVGTWSKEAGLKLVSLKPERLTEKKTLQEITFQAIGTGTMAAVDKFLDRLKTAKIPIRIRDLQVGSVKEGADDYTLQVRLSTLYQGPAAPAAGAGAAPAPRTGSPQTASAGGTK
jgi:hypothetical protein